MIGSTSDKENKQKVSIASKFLLKPHIFAQHLTEIITAPVQKLLLKKVVSLRVHLRTPQTPKNKIGGV